jgi:hypothetical protein
MAAHEDANEDLVERCPPLAGHTGGDVRRDELVSDERVRYSGRPLDREPFRLTNVKLTDHQQDERPLEPPPPEPPPGDSTGGPPEPLFPFASPVPVPPLPPLEPLAPDPPLLPDPELPPPDPELPLAP